MTESQRRVLFVRPAREKGAFVIGLSDPEECFTVGHALYQELGEVRGGDVLLPESVALVREEHERRLARRAAISILSYADNSCRRLAQKLRQKGISPAVAEATVCEMVAEGLLCEKRQLESAVLSLSSHKLFGPYRILADLVSKGYPAAAVREAIQNAVQNGQVDFKDSAKRLIRKKLGDTPDEDKKRKLLFTYGYKR